MTGTWQIQKLIVGIIAAASVAGCAPSVNQYSTTGGARPAAQAQATAPQAPKPPERPAPEATHRAAILLPLSGAQASLGQNLLNAAQMSVMEVGGDDFTLMPLDTQGTADGARTAAQKAMNHGAQIIIGPVFTPEVEAVKPVAQSRFLPLLALSNNSALAGTNAYVLGLTPADQAARLQTYAAAKGLAPAVVLAPTSAYGNAFVDGTNGLTVYRYSTDADLPAALDKLAASGPVKAILLAESGPFLQPVLDGLKSHKLEGVQLLGPALWAQSTNQSVLPAGALYTDLDKSERTAFTARYAQNFATAPAPIASLAYDATAMAAVLARQNMPYTADNLTSNQGFTGTDGLLRLNRDGSSTRGWTLYRTTPTGPEVADPAPARFDSGT